MRYERFDAPHFLRPRTSQRAQQSMDEQNSGASSIFPSVPSLSSHICCALLETPALLSAEAWESLQTMRDKAAIWT
jgi:K+-transporting ATPase c subunit